MTSPFRTRDAEALGVSTDTLRGPLFWAPFHGVRASVELERTLDLLAAAALIALPPGSALSCHTAAGLRRLAVAQPTDVHATVPRVAGRIRVEGISVHSRVQPAIAPSVFVRGVPTSSPVDMFLELAEYLPLIELVSVGDELVRYGWMELEVLRASVAAATRRRGIVRARLAVDLVRPRVDSPMETRVRLLFVLAGLPCPDTGYRVIVNGHVLGRFDLALPAFRIIIEYDGDLHRTSKKKWRSDVAKREALRELGWSVLVLTWDDYAVRPAATVGRLARELARRGYPDVPPEWRDGPVDRRCLSAPWQQAFPGASRPAWDWADAPSA